MSMMSQDLMWWITAIEVPVMAGLFYLIWRTRHEYDEALRYLTSLLDARHSQLRESLSAYKLEVAKTYAVSSDVKELEKRLIEHLIRIEAKLDKTALKTERMHHDDAK